MIFFKKHEARLFYLVLPLFLFLFPLVSAAPPFLQSFQVTEGIIIQYPLISVIQQNQQYTFEFHLFNLSNGMPLNSGISCYFHLYNSKGEHQIFANVSTVAHTWDYEVDVTGKNFSQTGVYSYIMQCNNTSIGGAASVQFEVVKSGIDEQTTTYFPIMYFLIILAFSILVIGYKFDNILIKTMAAFMLMVLGVSITINGINGINDWVIRAVGIILISIGVYIGIMSNEVEF